MRFFFRTSAVVFSLVALFVVGSFQTAEAADTNKPCDVRSGYQIQKDDQVTIGHITALSIGRTVFEPDTIVPDPMDLRSELNVVAVMNHMAWTGGPGDPISLSGQLSKYNKKNFTTLLSADLRQPVYVEFSFSVYDFDPEVKQYYASVFGCDPIMNIEKEMECGIMKGVLEFSGIDPLLSVDDNPNRQVISPENYSFTISILPPEKGEQDMVISFSTEMQTIIKWGFPDEEYMYKR